MGIDERLAELNIELPPAAKPVGAYVAAVRTGNLVFTAGQLPLRDGELVAVGKVPEDIGIDAAQVGACQAALNALAAIQAEVGSLDAVKRVVRVNCFVNSSTGFTDQAKVANGASEILVDIFGDLGRHTRCALGAAELPLNATVELDLIVEVS
ncbi:MAG: RidA family protein [Planctomycetota bacterium]|jgi:enamine deaminase RidA (YjgF/YER057c/UK114 family)